MKKIKFMAFILFTFLLTTVTVHAVSVPKKQTIEKYLDETANYLIKSKSELTYGSVGGEWAMIGLARYGAVSKDYISKYKENLTKHIKDCQGVLSERKYTEYARVVLALTAIGENPKNFCGYNLLKPLSELDNVKRQGANGIVYTLIALDCRQYEIENPLETYHGEVTTREKLIELILDAEIQNGGWAYSGNIANADVTAMALQALAPYYKKNNNVKKSVDRGLKVLSELQCSDGGFKTGNIETCESTAQVLTALSELHISISDKRFVKEENSVLDGLLKYYKKGAFCHQKEGVVSQMATEQAMYALTSYYRNVIGANGIYDMTDGINLRIIKTENFKNKEPISTETKDKVSKNKLEKNLEQRETTTAKENQQKKQKEELKNNAKEKSESGKDTKAKNFETKAREQEDKTAVKEQVKKNPTKEKKLIKNTRKKMFIVVGCAILIGGCTVVYIILSKKGRER